MTDGCNYGELTTASLRPNLTVTSCGTGVIALLSFSFLPWQTALAATLLGALMVAGADIDRRTFLLPDIVTCGGAVLGIAFAPLLDDTTFWNAIATAALRAAGLALLIGLLRASYQHLRGREGLGFGDVKLAAAVGAWLPLAAIPYCFGLAAIAGLIVATFTRHEGPAAEMKLPLGAFLCPALWLVFFIHRLFISHPSF